MDQIVHSNGKCDAAVLQQRLVDELKQRRYIKTPRIEDAFRTVPRHLFLPDVALEEVYRDTHIITKKQDGIPLSSSSQPSMMAIMLELLDLHPGQHVLEIGAGTGYNAALMAYLVGDTGQVTTIDIDEDIVAAARAHLKAADFEQVQVVCGDGGLGYPSIAPYDRIVLTVGAADIAQAWYEQLALSGRLVLPLQLTPFQSKLTMDLLVVFDRVQEALRSVTVQVCKFMALRGAFAPASVDSIALGPNLTLVTKVPVDATALYRALIGPSQDEITNVRIKLSELGGLHIWLALHEPAFCDLYAEGDAAKSTTVPMLIGEPGMFIATFGVCEQTTLSVLHCPYNSLLLTDQSVDHEEPFDLLVRTFGSWTSHSHSLIEHIRLWDHVGRPFTWTPEWMMKNLRIQAYFQRAVYVPENGLIVDKQGVRLVCDWQ